MDNHNIARQAKHQSIVHMKCTCQVLSCSIMSKKVELAFIVEEIVGVFSKFLSVALSVSFNRFSTKETTCIFCEKADNFAYFLQLYFQQISAIQIT